MAVTTDITNKLHFLSATHDSECFSLSLTPYCKLKKCLFWSGHGNVALTHIWSLVKYMHVTFKLKWQLKFKAVLILLFCFIWPGFFKVTCYRKMTVRIVSGFKQMTQCHWATFYRILIRVHMRCIVRKHKFLILIIWYRQYSRDMLEPMHVIWQPGRRFFIDLFLLQKVLATIPVTQLH